MFRASRNISATTHTLETKVGDAVGGVVYGFSAVMP